ncbi:hypothetical protein WA171_003590 [Blastocystis sp. BT1]
MKRNHLFLFLIFLFLAVGDEETKNDETDPLSLHALLPFQQCVATGSCHLCTSQNLTEPACKSTGYIIEYVCNRTLFEGNATQTKLEPYVAACRKPLGILQTNISLITMMSCFYGVAVICTIIIFLSRNWKRLRGYRRVRSNSV